MKHIKDLEDKCLKKVYISDSSISGQGVFAGQDIKKGEIIFVLGGTMATLDERYNGTFLRSTCIGISENFILGELSCSKKEKSDYINHSCEPNLGLLDAITIIAISNIKKGSELTIDYSFWEGNESWTMKHHCSCGSQNCRKTISGSDWKKVSSQSTMFNYYSPYIKRRIMNHEESKT